MILNISTLPIKISLKSVRIMLFFTISILTAYFLIGQNLYAKLYLIDDHTIYYFLGQKGYISIAEIPQIIFDKTEIGLFGTYTRFRPAYVLLLILETMLWKDNAFLWYLARFFIFTFAFATCWYFVSKVIGDVASYFFTVAVATLPFWVDVWTRLGPSEIYAVLGTTLYCISYYSISKNKNTTVSWFILLLGSFICIGSKENFIILVIPTWFLLLQGFVINKQVFSKLGLLVAITTTLTTIIVITAVSLGIKYVGHDVYQHQVSLLSKLHLVINYLRVNFGVFKPKITLPLLLIAGYSAYKLKLIYINNNFRKELFLGLLLLSFLIFVVLFQVFFYGSWPTNMRYDFPGIVAIWFIYIILAFIVCNSVPYKYKNIVEAIVIVTIMIVAVKNINPKRISLIVKASNNNKIITKKFDAQLKKVASELKANNYILQINTSNPDEFEQVVSLDRFFRGNGVQKSRFYLKYTPSKESDNPLSDSNNALHNFAKYGYDKKTNIHTTFTSIEKIFDEDINKCIAVNSTLTYVKHCSIE